ncbi:MAG: hypothetical protein M1816_001051 [Peltula sp. TS41687]|nr:MAG: hypothetical protein M1816_001051 [Peltula sp. TS41687]
MSSTIASTNMNSHRHDHEDEFQAINRARARLNSSESMSMAGSQAMQHILMPNTISAYAPSTSSYPFYQSMTAMEGPHLGYSLPSQSQLFPNDGQGPLMPIGMGVGLMASLPQTISHESMSHVFDGSELTLSNDQSSSPYFRTSSPVEESALVSPTLQPDPKPTEPIQPDLEGFVTNGEFDTILDDYIISLSPKKRDKALIPQKRYDNILRVLRDPKDTTIESAQFRFWAKKMFKLGTPDRPVDEIVLHENRPVAVRESLYRVLTSAHGGCQHGGRDKTSMQVRRQYSCAVVFATPATRSSMP